MTMVTGPQQSPRHGETPGKASELSSCHLPGTARAQDGPRNILVPTHWVLGVCIHVPG